MTYTLRCDQVGFTCDWISHSDTSSDTTTDYIAHLQHHHDIDRPSQSLQEYLNRHVVKHDDEPPARDTAFGSSALADTWPAAVVQNAQARLRMRGNRNG